MAILDEVKNALRVSHNNSDSEIQRLINSAMADLGIAGVEVPSTLDDICTTACPCNGGSSSSPPSPEASDWCPDLGPAVERGGSGETAG